LIILPIVGITGPAHVQLAQRDHLFKCDSVLAVELEQRQERGDHLVVAVRRRGQLAEAGPAHPAQPCGDEHGLLTDAHERCVDMISGHHGRRFRRERPGRERGELMRTQVEQHLGQQFGEPRLERHSPREHPGGGRHLPGEDPGDLLVGAVLQQPREQQVPGLEQREVFLVLDLARGQQPGRLQVKQRRRHDEEVAHLIQVPAAGTLPDIGDELVCDLGQRHLGDVQLVLGDQPEQQVERTLEHVEVYLEAARSLRRVVAGLARDSVTRHRHQVSRHPSP
jgi:hypothetical protein